MRPTLANRRSAGRRSERQIVDAVIAARQAGTS
jgi:hypothetical protein